MKFTIIKKIVLISALFASLIVKEAYSITAAQAAQQQQISKEIEDILTKKVDESNYNGWIEEINGLINKYKGVNLPEIQTKIKSLQTIVAIEKKPESVEEKVDDTKKIIKNQPPPQGPPTPNLNQPNPQPQVPTVLTPEEEKRLVEVNKLIEHGTDILGKMQKETLKSTIIDYWKKNAAEAIAVQSLNQQIKNKIDDLKNLLGMIETQQTTTNQPTISQDEQKIIEKIDELVKQVKDHKVNYDRWITDIEKIYDIYIKSTSTTVESKFKELRSAVQILEQNVYNHITKLNAGPNELESVEEWKKTAKTAINFFNQNRALAEKIGATVINNSEVKKLEQKLTEKQQEILTPEEVKILVSINTLIDTGDDILLKIKQKSKVLTQFAIDQWQQDALEIIFKKSPTSQKIIEDRVKNLDDLLYSIQKELKQPTN